MIVASIALNLFLIVAVSILAANNRYLKNKHDKMRDFCNLLTDNQYNL